MMFDGFSDNQFSLAFNQTRAHAFDAGGSQHSAVFVQPILMLGAEDIIKITFSLEDSH